jgi:hypothetical protein
MRAVGIIFAQFLGCKNDDKGRVRLKRLFGAFSFYLLQ